MLGYSKRLRFHLQHLFVKYRLPTMVKNLHGEVHMDWKGVVREFRLLLLQLPPFRFLAVWLLLLIALIGFMYGRH